MITLQSTLPLTPGAGTDDDFQLPDDIQILVESLTATLLCKYKYGSLLLVLNSYTVAPACIKA